jgi:hypothetical protein
MSLHEITLNIHIASVFVAGAGVLWADHVAFDWWRGKKEIISHQTLRRLHAWVGIALGLLIGSGTILFWPMRNFLLTEPLFLLKLAFVGILIINSVVIDSLLHHAATYPYRSLTFRQKAPLFISGALSATCWAGSILIALYIF